MNWFRRNGDEAPNSIESPEPPLPVVVEVPPVEQPRELALLSEAHRAISEARTFDEIKSIRDKAEAARKYAESASLGLEIQNYAAEVKIRAERRAGELLAELRLAGGDRRSKESEQRLKLEDLGVTKDQSSRWQRVARVPEDEFERYVTQTKEQERELTSTGVSRLASKPPRSESAPAAAQQQPATGGRLFTSLAELVRDAEPFGCIYASPPWESSLHGGTAGFHKALAELPVRELAAEGAHLHLWTSDDSLSDALQLIATWGFEFRGGLVWLKPQSQAGEYWAAAHELLLLGVRGSLPFVEQGVPSWLRAAATDNGSKPEKVRSLLQRVSPGPYLELFANKAVSGWTGYQISLRESAADSPPPNTAPEEPHE